MRHRLPLLLIAFFAAHPLLAAPLMETWEAGYTGSDATGPHVIAYWKFDGDSPEEALRDLSGNGHNLTLQGDGVLSASGKSGGALESFPGFPVQSKRHAAAAPHRPDLSPASSTRCASAKAC